VVFLTNLLELGATTIAKIYKDRWKACMMCSCRWRLPRKLDSRSRG
jgi:hypothetical protein